MEATAAEPTTVNVFDKANEAWADAALADSRVAGAALRRKLAKALDLFDGDLEVDPDYFDTEVSPWMRVAIHRDGVTFCFTKDRHVAVLAWQCAKLGKDGCDTVNRSAFGDYKSLGHALAVGAAQPETCGRH